MLDNKIIRTALILLVIAFLLPISNYMIEAIIGLGRIMGTCTRLLGTI